MIEELDNRTARIRIHDSMRPVYDKLCGGTNIEQSPFPLIKDVFIFAACLGFNKNNRKSLPAGKKSGMRPEVFSDSDRQIMKAIALAATDDISVLEKKIEEKLSTKALTIIEEYAHGGIEDLKAVTELHGYPLYNLVDLLAMNADNSPISLL